MSGKQQLPDLEVLADLVAERLQSMKAKPSEPSKRGDPMARTGVRKKGNSWSVATTIGGHRIDRSGFRTKAAAAEWLWRVRSDRSALADYLRTKLDRSTIPVSDLLEHYWRKRASRLRAAERWRQIQGHLTRHLGKAKAAEVRQAHIDEYLAKRTAESVSEKTAWNEAAYLRTALRYAWRNDLLVQPPKFVLKKPKCERKRVAWPEEMKALFDAADLPMRRVLLAGWTMGLRRSEIIEARWSWITPARELAIPASVAKTDEDAVVPIPPGLWDLLQQQVPRHPERVFSTWRLGRNGKAKPEPVPWAKTTLRRRWQSLCLECGSGNLRLHDLRRSMSTVGQERGHSRDSVRQVGRWADERVMMKHYSHAGREHVSAVGVDLEGLLTGAPQQGEADQLEALTGPAGRSVSENRVADQGQKKSKVEVGKKRCWPLKLQMEAPGIEPGSGSAPRRLLQA